MRKWILILAVLAGCYVEERPVRVRPPHAPPCPNGIWVEGHYGAWGRWHPAHWRCERGVIIEAY
jgi:hypothetical protein